MFCALHVRGVQLPASGAPHWPGTPPPPHVCGAVQAPQSSWPPQPSPAGPQVMFCCWHDCGVQLGAPQGPHTPVALPSTWLHCPPQQSELSVQLPHAATQLVAPHTYGGEPAVLGTHGSPLQQSALDAHALPAPTHATPVHRGTPTLSALHVSIVLQLPAQQSHDALHDIVASLHTSPFGLHPWGLTQTPTLLPAGIEQTTGLPEPPGSPAAPQQSVSRMHRSPTGWQPLAVWQTSTPVGPYGAQRRLQHEPPHVGAVVPEAPQTVPSTIEQLAEPAEGCPHVPYVLPLAIVQTPPQQSDGAEHTSPDWRQYDDAAHRPPVQSCEQHCEFCVHVLPSVRQAALSVSHVPDVHAPLQHCEAAVQEPPSETHVGKAHTPPVHCPVQHCPENEHALPMFRHVGGGPESLTPLPHLLKPPPPQNCGALHEPQLSSPPHPSPAGPQLNPSCWHVRGTHKVPPSADSPSLPPQTLNPPPPQYWGFVHEPQLSVPPQPSPATPQVKPSCWHVLGRQSDPPPASALPHLKKPPPPHVWPPGHMPQSSRPPQPSAAGPHP
jgi:hypothetical protein